MLGGSDTSGSVLGSRSGGIAASASGTISGGGSGGRNGSNEAAAVVAADAGNMFNSNGNNSNNNSGEDDNRVGGGRVDEGDGRSPFGGGGNRWPRQETLALLKIRSDMDSVFREASVKGPLWDEVSRKLADLGYHRNAKKCKEKFENVYKYHKRTKDGRTGKSDGKTYRFFDQLEAFQSQPSIQPSPPPQPQQVKPAMTTATNPPNIVLPNINLTVPSFPLTNPTSQSISPPPPISPTIPSFPNISVDLMSNSTSSSTSSDLGLEGNRKRKRKWKDFFERLMKEVIQKQEEMQKKFLEAIEKREHERMVREEAWRMQEMSRFNREREILAHERSVAAAKDAAVMSFLQKLSEQQNPSQAQKTNPLAPSPSPPQPQPPPPPQQQKQEQLRVPPKPVSTMASVELPAAGVISAPAAVLPVPAAPMPVMNSDADNGDQTYAPSPSRWPKVEIEALIKIRTSLDSKYQDNGPKGPLWEEISSAMQKLGYNRNAKRCKEKWENINKYYKKVKESNKKRPEDSKTCPYFHQLDALYREKNKHDGSSKLPENNSVPLMVRPEQQWPPRPEPDRQDERDHVMEDMESDHNEDEEEEEDDGGSYEIVASKPVSMGT